MTTDHTIPVAGATDATATAGTSDAVTVLWTSADDPRAAPLVAELSREYDERYGLNDGIPSSVELSRYPAELFAESHGGAFLLLVRNGETIAGGAFKKVDATTAEIKRVWASSAHRRQGLARRVMAELESEALRRGYSVAALTTGARQPEAVQLYLALGYSPLFDLDGDLEEISYLHFEKRLTGETAGMS
ncbi:GNAT family N-acetyltransferase [Glaciihabitans sp. dw_435]|uniref:GNAT family N-acetyltransferase n=1 Tax=Glaciihabitans sp. dw_435 TaxID=2720081 RepID=UPI0027DE33FF|nr:GNAT family N-acetyltransferase [Glaciihabitans sp. dw_435]